MTLHELIVENNRRMKSMYEGFDPITGEGAPPYERTWLNIIDMPDIFKKQLVPDSMLQDKMISDIVKYGSISQYIRKTTRKRKIYKDFIDEIIKEVVRVRCQHDFCFWAYMFVRIKPKSGGKQIRFKLSHEQRVLLSNIEGMRINGDPIRIILLKARQWGGSTLVQIYMAWIQLCHRDGWYSTIVAQNKDVSLKIKAMYSKLLEFYPSWLLDIEDRKLEFTPYEGSSSDYAITHGVGYAKNKARDTVITIGTYERPDSTRGGDTALVHYSEVAFWSETKGKKPEEVIRSISGGLLEVPLTVEVLESTANGTGNFFHREWIRAKRGESSRTPVFIPWYYIEHDSKKVADEFEFARWLLSCRGDMQPPKGGWRDPGQYYWYLWEQGATFAGINWYRYKRKSFNDHSDMASEAPSNDIEAFKHSGRKVFDLLKIDAMSKLTYEPKYIGEVTADLIKGRDALDKLKFLEDNSGRLLVWEMPEKNNHITYKYRYLVVVDVGGRSESSDYSVITVFDRMPIREKKKPKVVADWIGHIDHDLLAWKSAQIAAFYSNALLVIESNTLESRDSERDTEGDHTEFILNKIARKYKNLYARQSSESDIKEGKPRKWGFHTNSYTKPLIIDNLISSVRDLAWDEPNKEAVEQLSFYERKDSGAYGAVSGQHDDILMTRAIGLHVCFNEMPIPKEVDKRVSINNARKRNSSNMITEATI